MRNTLLRQLPGFFAKDCQAVLALRIVPPPYLLDWRIDNEYLTLTPIPRSLATESNQELIAENEKTLAIYPCGLQPLSAESTQNLSTESTAILAAKVAVLPSESFSLNGTLANLATALAAAGYTIEYLNPDLAARHATVLLPGEGRYRHGWVGATDLLWAHLTALGQELTQADAALAALFRQLILPTARESWADYWGSYFGVARLPGESDADYTQRIIDEFYRARNNPVAMIKNVRRYTGYDIELFEPWTRMWTLSRSALSRGDDHLPSGDYYAYHWLHPIARTPVDWAAILPVLEADRPAGTLLIAPGYWFLPSLIAGDWNHWQLHSAQHATRYCWARAWWEGVLSATLRLSASELTRQWRCAQTYAWTERWFLLRRPHRWTEVAAWDTDPWTVTIEPPFSRLQDRRTFCQGEIVLSDSAPLGDLQAHLPGRRWQELGGPLCLSEDGALSDAVWRLERQPIDVWQEQARAQRADYLADPALYAAAATDSGHYADPAFWVPPRIWENGWDTESWRSWRQPPVGFAWTTESS